MGIWGFVISLCIFLYVSSVEKVFYFPLAEESVSLKRAAVVLVGRPLIVADVTWTEQRRGRPETQARHLQRPFVTL